MYFASVCDVPIKTYLPENDRSAPRFFWIFVLCTVYGLVVVVMRFFKWKTENGMEYCFYRAPKLTCSILFVRELFRKNELIIRKNELIIRKNELKIGNYEKSIENVILGAP